jgi:hypothetical protein
MAGMRILPHTFIRAQHLRVSTSTSIVQSLIAHSRNRSTMSTSTQPQITAIKSSDFSEWSRLFRAYIAFYKSDIPDTQYRQTFDRLVDPSTDLFGLVLRDPQDPEKLLGLAHYFPHQTPWSNKQIMHFNGTHSIPLYACKYSD